MLFRIKKKNYHLFSPDVTSRSYLLGLGSFKTNQFYSITLHYIKPSQHKAHAQKSQRVSQKIQSEIGSAWRQMVPWK